MFGIVVTSLLTSDSTDGFSCGLMPCLVAGATKKNCEKAFVVEMRFRRIDLRIEIFLTLYFQLGRLFVEVSSVFVDDIVKKQIDENDQHVGGRNEEKIGSFFQENFDTESLQNPTWETFSPHRDTH